MTLKRKETEINELQSAMSTLKAELDRVQQQQQQFQLHSASSMETAETAAATGSSEERVAAEVQSFEAQIDNLTQQLNSAATDKEAAVAAAAVREKELASDLQSMMEMNQEAEKRFEDELQRERLAAEQLTMALERQVRWPSCAIRFNQFTGGSNTH